MAGRTWIPRVLGKDRRQREVLLSLRQYAYADPAIPLGRYCRTDPLRR
jgi:hypothetical protein